MRSMIDRSISVWPPMMSSETCLLSSRAAWRTTRYRRSERLSNSTMRVRNRSPCSSRAWRVCDTRLSSEDCRARAMLRRTDATSLTDSAIIRVSSCTRVKRSNSSGSKWTCESADCAMRDCIWLSACSSMSRNWIRSRSRLPSISSMAWRNCCTSVSSRARLVMISPVRPSMRSRMFDRTRTRG